MKKRIISIVTDITIAAVIVLAVWIVGYKFPQEGIRAIAFEADQRISPDEEEKESETLSETKFQTAFAQDTYGVGYTEKLSDMSSAMKSVLAVNGDSYSNNRHRKNGTIIRNGVVYRNRPTDMETCVLNWDGTMDIYSPDQMDLQKLIEKGAYQSWIFGPSLLDENGKAKESFLTWNYIEESHPRTANHPYKPEHEVTDGIFIRENPIPGI